MLSWSVIALPLIISFACLRSILPLSISISRDATNCEIGSNIVKNAMNVTNVKNVMNVRNVMNVMNARFLFESHAKLIILLGFNFCIKYICYLCR